MTPVLDGISSPLPFSRTSRASSTRAHGAARVLCRAVFVFVFAEESTREDDEDVQVGMCERGRVSWLHVTGKRQ